MDFVWEALVNITVVYDSIFGNTAKVAAAIAGELERDNSVRLATVQEAGTLDLSHTDLLIVGSPTRGFRPTPQISEYLGGLKRSSEGASTAVFDTRMNLESVKPGPLRWVVGVGGYAASRMDDALRSRGFVRKGDIAGFLVTGMEGPLKPGELERAVTWARSLLQ